MNDLTKTVLLGTSLLGAASGLVGTWGVLRRQALLSDVLAHAALPGLCAAFWIVGETNYAALLLGSLVSGLCSVLIVTLLPRWTRLKMDAAMGLVLSVAYALGVVLLSLILRSSKASGSAGLERFTLGQAALLTQTDLYWIAGVGLAVTLVIVLFYKEFQLLGFDVEFGKSLGWPVLWLDLILMTCIAAVTVVGIKSVGVLLTPAVMIMPAATARFWTERLRVMLCLAALVGAVAGATGTLLTSGELGMAASVTWNQLPTGPVIVLCGATLFVLSLCFGPKYGLLVRWRQQRTQLQLPRVPRSGSDTGGIR